MGGADAPPSLLCFPVLCYARLGKLRRIQADVHTATSRSSSAIVVISP